MGWPSRTGQAVVAVASLLTLVNGQGYLSTVEGELAKCTSDNFVFLGCYKGFEPTGEPYFRFSPAVYEPNGDPSRSFPKYNPGSDYDDTTTPLNCARVCRGYGYKFSSLANNNCRCGSQIPPVLVTTGATCNEQCHGDATLTCGGFQDAGIWLDPTFADPSVVPIVDQNVGLATSYQHLGCYYQPDFPTQDPRASQPRLGMDNCLAYCAGLGYPLVYARSIAAGQVQCECGQAFGHESYRADPATLDTPGDCSSSCVTGVEGACDLETGRCCGQSNYFPVYINPELMGCYTPQIPGYYDTITKRFTCYDIPLSLQGPPKILTLGTNTAAALDPINPGTGLDHPAVVTTQAGTIYYLYGCYGTNPLTDIASALIGVILGALSTAITNLHPATLENCAANCAAASMPFMGMVNGRSVEPKLTPCSIT
ncbi:hypothetical protein B0T17DRAFT_632144 [Bombardia bombarda]|uniref:WSC domain-containing protein n=1 Tax=Bombardia bombarda TaxID=252184 RepID=A0AA39X898_9PEZI|nr:hypothetical protein B0T17DRAFT_632144 [Bombardia bombarda]